MTVFLSGKKDPFAIITFDWTTLQYKRQAARLLRDRVYCACSLLNGDNGEKVVAVAGGRQYGMEVWNPLDGSVKMLTTSFPTKATEHSTMISVKQNSELIFYENADAMKGIWKYFQVNNTWTKIGEKFDKAGFCFEVLPVTGISCP